MRKKFIVDVLLYIMLVLLMLYNFTGNFIHELLGVVSFVIFLIHLIINKKVILRFIKKIKNANAFIIVDIVLVLSFLLTFITGVIISISIFSFLKISFSSIIVEIHKYSSYLMLISFLIHFIFHLDNIIIYISNLFNIEDHKRIKAYIIIVAICSALIIIRNNLIRLTNHDEKLDDSQINNIDEDNDSLDEGSNDNPPTLNEYLSKLHCQGCHNRCVLTSFRCNRGSQYYEQAKNDYYQEYGNGVSYYDENTYESTDGEYKIKL